VLAVASPINEELRSNQEQADILLDLLGSWVSGSYATKNGEMQFELTFTTDGIFEVLGVSTISPNVDQFYRASRFDLRGNTLVSLAINEGRPVDVRIIEGELFITIDDSLWLQLRKR
jgi:hypothetical protein